MNYLKPILSLLFFVCFIPSVAFSQTPVSGIISSNTTWTKANSPYNITGNTQVNEGVTLTIEPGVRVVFNGDFSFRAFGPIIAEGTATDSIYFETNSPTTKIGKGIFIRSTATANFDSNFNYLSGTIFKYCSFENLGRGIFNYQSGVSIENCNFLNNDIAWEPRSNLKTLVINSKFTKNNYALFTFGEDQTTGDNVACIKDILITNNEFNENNYGISIGMNQRTVADFKVSNNKFYRNSNIGISIGGGGYGPYVGDNVEISNNKFIENQNAITVQVYNLGYNGCSGGGWGTNNELLISKNSFIKDQNAVNLNGIAYANVTKNVFDATQRGVYIGTSSDRRSNNSIQSNQFFKVSKPIVIFANGIYYQTENNLVKRNTFQTFLSKQVNPIISINTRVNNNQIIENNFSLYDSFILSNTDIGNVPFSGNYTLPSRTISNDINDQNDNIDLGLVQISNSSTTPLTIAPISIPLGVRKDLNNGRVVLTWTANTESDIAGYKIYYGGYTGYSFSTVIDVGNVTTYTLPAGISLNEPIAVTAYDTSKDGTDDQFDGNESWYSLANTRPSTPSALAGDVGPRRVRLTWTAGSSGAADAYYVYRSTDNVNFTRVASTTNLHHVDQNLTGYTSYYYKVSAFDSLDLSYENYGLESERTATLQLKPTRKIYVGTNGANSNIGSEAAPLRAIQAGIDYAITGDSIFVAAGTYKENLRLLGKELHLEGISGPTQTILEPLQPTTILYMENAGSSRFNNFTFTKGAAQAAGSAFAERLSSPIFDRCIFRNNGGSGGIIMTYAGSFTISNSLFFDNNPNTLFEFSNSVDAVPLILHCTFVNNENQFSNAGQVSFVPKFVNCIIWSDTRTSVDYNGALDIESSIYKGTYSSNTTNLNQDPKFVNSAAKDFRLSNFSPPLALAEQIILYLETLTEPLALILLARDPI